MLSASTKRNTFRSLLALHFVGLALTIGGRIADFVIEQQTSRSSLQALALGRDLTGTINKGLGLPGFLIIALTGIAMTVLRYGRRPPIWVWIKIGLNLTVLFVASPLVRRRSPALGAGPTGAPSTISWLRSSTRTPARPPSTGSSSSCCSWRTSRSRSGSRSCPSSSRGFAP